jgi:hypothetical protein
MTAVTGASTVAANDRRQQEIDQIVTAVKAGEGPAAKLATAPAARPAAGRDRLAAYRRIGSPAWHLPTGGIGGTGTATIPAPTGPGGPLDGPVKQTTFSEPFLIWEVPTMEEASGVITNVVVQPFSSKLSFKIEDHHSRWTRQFGFYFIWSNDAATPAPIDVQTSMMFAGTSSVSGAAGIISGTEIFLITQAYAEVQRWSGWGNDPMTGDHTDVINLTGTNTSAVVTSLRVRGGRIFGQPGRASQHLPLTQFHLDYTGLTVPPGASVLFRVMCQTAHEFDDGGGKDDDSVVMDFAPIRGSSAARPCP